MDKKEVKASPRLLQHLALGGVVVFALVISYAIYITNQTVNEVNAGHYDLMEQAAAEQQRQIDQRH